MFGTAFIRIAAALLDSPVGQLAYGSWTIRSRRFAVLAGTTGLGSAPSCRRCAREDLLYPLGGSECP